MKVLHKDGKECVQSCIQDKKDAGKQIDDQAIAICNSECGESDKHVIREHIIKTDGRPILQKISKDAEGIPHIYTYSSSTLRDRDRDRFAKNIMNDWAETINRGKINIGLDHGLSWEDTVGVWIKGEVRQNPHGDDIKSAKYYLFTEGILEDPSINPKTKLLQHKAEIGEQISVSISANPATEKWFDKEIDTDGVPVRVIKSAELLKIDIVGEPANPDARLIGITLKHNKCDKGMCVKDCVGCFIEKDFSECINKSMIAPNTTVVSSLVTEKESKPIMTDTVKKSQEELNKEHGCKEGEKYCPDEGKCMPAEKEEEDKSTSLSPELSKFIEALKVISTTPESGGLESMIERALEQTRAIESANVPASPGLSGTSGAQPQATSTPAPALEQNRPIESPNVAASPGLSGTGPAPNTPQPTPAPIFEQNRPIESAQVQASDNKPQISKITVNKPGVSGILLDEKRTMEYIEKARLEAKPKNENPGEITLSLIDTTTLTGPLLKAAKEYNKNVIDQHASQVRQQYTPADIAKMAEEGKLVKQLDQDGNFEKKVIPAYAKTEQKVRKTITGSLLLQKHR